MTTITRDQAADTLATLDRAVVVLDACGHLGPDLAELRAVVDYPRATLFDFLHPESLRPDDRPTAADVADVLVTLAGQLDGLAEGVAA